MSAEVKMNKASNKFNLKNRKKNSEKENSSEHNKKKYKIYLLFSRPSAP